MSDGDHSALFELSSYCVLDEIICFQIHCCCCFIQNKDLSFPEKSSGQANQLALTHAENNVCITVADLVFSQGGVPTPKVDVKSYYLANFSQKLIEIEKNLDPRRCAPPAPP